MSLLRKFRIFLLSFICLFIFISPAFAYYQRFMNFGITNFLDGMPLPDGPGLYMFGHVTYYDAYAFTGPNGQLLPNTSLNSFALLPQLLYQSKIPVLKGDLGVNVLPVYVADINLPQNQLNLQVNHSGWDDLVVGPFIQWQPIMLGGHPFMANRLELDFYIPTGNFNAQDQINPGAHLWSFEPYWASTILLSQRWDISWRLQYLFNTQSSITGINPGDAFHANFSTSYAVIPPKLRLGLAGYYLKQTQNSSINGQTIPNSKEQVLGVGPGAVYIFSKRTQLFVNTYFESDVENRPVGSRFVLSILHHFC